MQAIVHIKNFDNLIESPECILYDINNSVLQNYVLAVK